MRRPVWIASAAALLVAGGLFAITTSTRAGAATAAPAPTVIATATAVTASPVPLYDLRCAAPSANLLAFTPPLTLVNQFTSVQRTTLYRSCSSFSQPGITSGYESRVVNVFDDCTMVLLPGTANFVVTWNTNQSTTFTANKVVTLSGNTLTAVFTGTVTAGLFAGRNVRQVFTANTPELVNCLAGGPQPVPFIMSDVSLVIYR